MKKLNLAIIGQGRSGKNIHGLFYRSESNTQYNVKYVVDADEFRRSVAEKNYPGCKTFADYTELFAFDDIDVVVNATYSEMHYSITKDLILHGFNVLVEKPFGRNRYEADELIKLAKEKGVFLTAFQQSFFIPAYKKMKEVIASGVLGDVLQVDISYNNFARRWDWQTLQKKLAGGIYNTGPHPIGLALGFLDFDADTRIVYSKLGQALTSGDSDDYAKVLLTAPGKPLVDVEVHSNDAFAPWNFKVLGTKGTMISNYGEYKLTYVVDGENPPRPVQETFLKDDAGEPIYCKEQLIKHEESGSYDPGAAFTAAVAELYNELYYAISEGKPMSVTAEMARDVVSVIDAVHAQNPLELIY